MAFSSMHLSSRRFYRVVLVATILVFIVVLYEIPRERVQDPGTLNLKDLSQRRLQFADGKDVDYAKPFSILVKTTKKHGFPLSGAVLNEKGVAKYVSVPGESGLLYSFSPEIEKAAASRVVDPAKDNIYYANSPAITWHNGRLVLVVRIWLDREKYEKKKNWPANQFADNFLFTQSFDRYLRPLNNGSFMGIPIPKQFWVGDGPIEPRVFKVGEKLLVSFNAAMALKKKFYVDWTTFWDFDDNRPIIPRIVGGSPMMKVHKDDIPRDKHWMSFTKGKDLYFVHNLDPLRVMRCYLNGTCVFVHKEETPNGFVFHRHRNHLRGGTPLELYKWPYYIGFAHVTLYKSPSHHRYYTANLIVFCADPYRLVFLGDSIQIHPDIYLAAPMVRPRWIDDNFIFPVGMILEDPDSVILGAHANDHSSILLRITGIRKLLTRIIEEDQQNSPKSGPPAMFMHKFVHDRTGNLTKVIFEKEKS